MNILLIEDSLADIRLFQEALKACDIPIQVTVLQASAAVLAFVRHAAESTQAPPQLIIVDMTIPGMEMEEVVAALRRLPTYAHIPVIVFSGLPDLEGQRRTACCGATAFVQKSVKLKEYEDTIRMIVDRWGRPDKGNPS